MIKYKTEVTEWNVPAEITEIEADRETEEFVWIRDQRIKKDTRYTQYHDSWDMAWSYLMLTAESYTVVARRELERKDSQLGNVKGMKRAQP